MRRVVLFATVLVVTLAFDQGSKVWARTLPVSPPGCAVPADLIARRCGGVPQPVIGGVWEWELALNPGAAFSFASEAGAQIILSLIAAAALVAIGIAASRTRPEQRLKRLAFAMIAGGALGNLIDRVRDGAVTDFVRWRIHEHRWPIFNVADVALFVGVALLLVDTVLARRRDAVA